MRLGFFLISSMSILYLFHPLFGPWLSEKKPTHAEILKVLNLNELCGGTQRCMPSEIAEQEREERWIIQGIN